MLLLIGFDGFLIDKVADLAETGFVGADLRHDLGQYFRDKTLLLARFEGEDSGFQFIESHGDSPCVDVIRLIAEI